MRDLLQKIATLEKSKKFDERNELLSKHWPEMVRELQRLLKLEEKWKTYVTLGQSIVQDFS